MIDPDQILCMDALAALKTLADESVDMVLTDPPYPIDTTNGTNRFTENGWFHGSSDDYGAEWYDWFSQVVAELTRVLRPGRHAYIYVDEKNLFLMKPVLDKHLQFKKVIVWHKVNIGLGYHYRNVIEYVMLYSKGDSTVHIIDQPNFFKAPKDDLDGHPTIKPVSMLRWLIENSSAPGELIIDPFLGSGSTAVAAKTTGRHYFGCDISPQFIALARSRVQQRTLAESLAIYIETSVPNGKD